MNFVFIMYIGLAVTIFFTFIAEPREVGIDMQDDTVLVQEVGIDMQDDTVLVQQPLTTNETTQNNVSDERKVEIEMKNDYVEV